MTELSTSPSTSTVTSKRLSGVRGVRAVASESWDEDFLWQHSSSSDLHLPSSSTRHHRSSMSSSANAKDHRHRSSSSRSTLTNASSTSSHVPTGTGTGNRQSRSSALSTDSRWGYASRLSLQEDLDGLELDEEVEDNADEDPTIILNNDARLKSSVGTPQNRAKTDIPLQRASTSPAVPQQQRKSLSPAKSHRPPTSSARTNRYSQPVPPLSGSTDSGRLASSPDNLTLPSSSPSLSLASWRSPTPSLTSDVERATYNTSSSSSSSTETDNETEHENDADLLDNVLEVGNGSMSSTGTGGGGNNTPRLGFASLFGRRDRGNTLKDSSGRTEESENRKKSGSISLSTPLFGRKNSARANSGKRKETLSHVQDPALEQMNRPNEFGRLPFTRSTSSSTSASSSAHSAVYGTSPPSSYLSSSSCPNSFQGTPTILSLKEQIQNNRTIRARQNSSNPPKVLRENSMTPPSSADTVDPGGWRGPNDARNREDEEGDVFSGIDDLETDQDTSSPAIDESLPKMYPYKGRGRTDHSTSSLVSTASTTAPSVSLSTESESVFNQDSMKRRSTVRRKLVKRPISVGKTVPPPAAQSVESVNFSISVTPGLGSAFAFPLASNRQSQRRDEAPPSPVASTSETTSSSTIAKTKRRSYRLPGTIRRRTTVPDSRTTTTVTAGSGEAIESSADEAAFPVSRSRADSGNTAARGYIGGKGKERMAFANDSEVESSVDQSMVSNVSSTAGEPASGGGGGWLSKRFSKEIKVSKVPFPSPERKRSGILATTAESAEVQERTQMTVMKEEIQRKPRRPLSLTAMLSRSTSPSISTTSTAKSSRTRSGTITTQSSGSTDQYSNKITPSPTSAVFSFGSSGTMARKKFVHRSTASSGNIPTAKSLLGVSGGLDRRQSVDFSDTMKAPPHLTQKRSFNPLSRNAASQSIQERPISSLSLLSETSTVRPASISRPGLTVNAQEISSALAEKDKDASSPTLRRRHLPSLSLSLLPGVTSSTPPRSAVQTPSFPLPSPSNVARPYTAAAASSSSPSGSGYFGTPQSQTAPGLKVASSPGGRSVGSSGSGRSAGGYMIRRVSLSDLRIPPRISNAQAKIGQDLQRVKEFKDGVEELKRLRNIYRSLVSSENTPDTSGITEADISSSSAEQQPSETSLFIPAEMTAKVDHIFARVAIDYRKWWEIADVLINLADGAEVEETADGSPDRRARCKSELPGRAISSSPSRSNGSPMKGRPVSEEIIPPLPTSAATVLSTASTSKPASDEGVDVTTPLSQISSPGTLNLPSPLLTRSQSIPTFSPSASTTGLSTEGAEGKGSREVVGLDGNPMSVSDRQLDILRAMLKPQGLTSSTMSTSGRSPLSSPLDELPTSPKLQTQSVIQPKPYLTPEKRLPTSFSLPSGLSTTPTSTPPQLAQTPFDTPDSQATPDSTPSSNVAVPSVGQKKSRSRLRQVSRAGMLGIREFLKALKRNGVNITLEPSPSSSSPTQPKPLTVVRPSSARRVFSEPQVTTSQLGCGHQTPIKNNLMAATMAMSDMKGSPLSLKSSGSSSDEEEDWDRRSSEDEEEEDGRGQDDSPSRSGGGSLLRSDTQATIMASASTSVNPAAVRTVKGKAATTRNRRGRTYSTNSTTTLALPGNWHMGAKLVMTTEAMPTLLAKIDEVKLHCSTCVTELRNVTV